MKETIKSIMPPKSQKIKDVIFYLECHNIEVATVKIRQKKESKKSKKFLSTFSTSYPHP